MEKLTTRGIIESLKEDAVYYNANPTGEDFDAVWDELEVSTVGHPMICDSGTVVLLEELAAGGTRRLSAEKALIKWYNQRNTI